MNGVITLEHAIGRDHHRLYACRHVRHLSLSLSQRLPHDSRRQSSNNKQPQKSEVSWNNNNDTVRVSLPRGAMLHLVSSPLGQSSQSNSYLEITALESHLLKQTNTR
jgi:hypothetical protein